MLHFKILNFLSSIYLETNFDDTSCGRLGSYPVSCSDRNFNMETWSHVMDGLTHRGTGRRTHIFIKHEIAYNLNIFVNCISQKSFNRNTSRQEQQEFSTNRTFFRSRLMSSYNKPYARAAIEMTEVNRASGFFWNKKKSRSFQ